MNIPIEVPESSVILQERTNSTMNIPRRGWLEKGEQHTRKWKRLPGKENIATGCAGMSTTEPNSGLGKRRWELQDEDDDVEAIVAVNKRIRRIQEVQEEDMNEVVVASLNWLQAY